MSLVGPRPFLRSEMEADPVTFQWRLPFLPGMTGLWQVAGRSWLPVHEGIRMDLTYVEHWSLWLDLRIMLRTLVVVLAGTPRPSPAAAPAGPELDRARYPALVDGDELKPRPGTGVPPDKRLRPKFIPLAEESAGSA